MKKIIDIDDDIVKDLKKMAIDSDLDLKNYIQQLLIIHVAKNRKEKRKITTNDLAVAYYKALGVEVSNSSEAVTKLQKELQDKTFNRGVLNKVTKELMRTND